MTGAAEQVLAALDPEQREAASAPVGPVCILAGAGTGKTRTITHRIAYQVLQGEMEGDRLLAVTFTARAAGELRSRLRVLGVPGVQARTFHAAALRQLSFFWPRLVGGRMPEVSASKARLVREAAGRVGLPAAETAVRDLAGEVEWAKSTLVSPAQYPARAAAAGREVAFEPEAVARVCAAYEEVKTRHGALDFEDLLLLMAGALEEHGDVAREVRSRYRHFLVDEYQDATPLQQRLLDGWLGGRDSLTVVGDPHQTIYGFGGASPELLTGFARRYPSAHVVRLVRDYRSTPQVVAAARAVLAEPGAQLQAVGPDGPAVTLAEAADEAAEAAGVAAAIGELIASGVAAREIAVLYRVNALSVGFEQALAAAGIPYLLRGGERFFERPEVREALLLLRGAARAADPQAPAELAAAVREVLEATGWRPGTVPAGGATRERWENLAALERLAAEFDGSLPEFVEHLAERADAQHAPAVDGVTLASLHAAKGLEWDAVFLVGLVDGTVPITYATTPAQLAEERRLLYVGVTRARRHLRLSWARARAAGGRGGRKPSRFLAPLLPAVVRPPRKGSAAAALPPGADPELFARLRAWRTAEAARLKQPAFCVFTDATLQALAAGRPSSLSQLGRVPGIGAVKRERYGELLLEMCAEAAPR